MSHQHQSDRHAAHEPQEHAHGAGHGGHTEEDLARMITREYWDERYGSSAAVWSGNVNPQLVAQVSGLTPGTALDVGSGEGADAIWLAENGWQVTGLDISTVALQRSAQRAARFGPEVASRIGWQQADLKTWEPVGAVFDLVSAQFMHLPRQLLKSVHQRLAGSVRPGGTLLIVGHHPADMLTRMGRPDFPEMFYTADEIAGDLDPAEWRIVVAEQIHRTAVNAEGEELAVSDAVLRAERRH